MSNQKCFSICVTRENTGWRLQDFKFCKGDKSLIYKIKVSLFWRLAWVGFMGLCFCWLGHFRIKNKSNYEKEGCLFKCQVYPVSMNFGFCFLSFGGKINYWNLKQEAWEENLCVCLSLSPLLSLSMASFPLLPTPSDFLSSRIPLPLYTFLFHRLC